MSHTTSRGISLSALLLTAVAVALVAVPEQRPATVQAAAAEPSPSPTPTVVTQVGDRTRARGDALRAQLDELFQRQSAALLAGDEAGFLSPAKQAKPRAELLRRYRNLTAMRVAAFELRPDALDVDAKTGHWRTSVLVRFCFVVPGCEPDAVREPMVFADTSSGLELVSIKAADGKGRISYGSTQPWEVSDLHVAIGARTLVATTARLKGRLPDLLREAEKAAVVADQFAVGARPDLYRVYLADRNEWKTWYDGEDASWAAGYEIAIGETRGDVVLNHSRVPASFLDDILRHELTHVSTLGGSFYPEGLWWFAEGIAELAEHPDGLTATSWRAETGSFVRGRWNRKLPGAAPPDDASASRVGALYGVSFLAVKCLDERFGRQKLLEYFAASVVNSGLYIVVAQDILGATWAEIESACVAYIRRHA